MAKWVIFIRPGSSCSWTLPQRIGHAFFGFSEGWVRSTVGWTTQWPHPCLSSFWNFSKPVLNFFRFRSPLPSIAALPFTLLWMHGWCDDNHSTSKVHCTIIDIDANYLHHRTVFLKWKVADCYDINLQCLKFAILFTIADVLRKKQNKCTFPVPTQN